MQTTAQSIRQPDHPTASSFGPLLRSWRNSRKFSQLELAMEADISQRHLSFLELGRARPSRSMVLQLAETLDVPLRERNVMLQAAGFTPAYAQRGLDGEEMAPVRNALSLMLKHHEPNPAVVIDKDWNVVMKNNAVERAFSAIGDLAAMWEATCGDGPRNLLRFTFHPQGIRPFIANLDELAPIFLQRTYREAVTTQNHDLLALLKEIAAWPDMPAAWLEPSLNTPPAPIIPLVIDNGVIRASLFTMISTFGTPQDITTDELRIESYFPADEQTAMLLNMLAASGASASDQNS